MKKTTTFFLKGFRGFVAVLMTLVVSMAFAQNSYTVQFQDETIEMPENIDTFQWNQMPAFASLESGYVGWIQFYETPSQAIQDEFKTRGLQLLNYIPHNTYLFYFPENTSVAYLSDSGVRSITAVDGRTKLSSALKNPPYESYAVDGDNILVVLQHHKNINQQYVINELAAKQITVTEQYPNSNNIRLSIPNNCLEDLSNLSFVKWVELVPAPPVKDDLRGRNLHRSSSLDTQIPGGRSYDGEGIGVMCRDDGAVGPHIDFAGRQTGLIGANGGNTHGDGVSGIMAGAGNVNPANRGMAAGANLHVINYTAHFLDGATTSVIASGQVQITNSSYSNGCNAGYTSATETVDTQTIDTPSLLHVFSAGNSNNQNCGYGAGSQWGNITGGHKQGKNVIATANVFFDGSLVNSSSRGPAYDGRIKPDIGANGQNQISTSNNNTYQTFGGTSGAAPGIAGISAQLYQAYSEANGGTLPQSALIKAALLNTANDYGNVGPDYKFGWGIVNALRAVQLIEDSRYLSSTISDGDTNTHTIAVPAGTTQVRFMVYWSDVPATPGADPALVNDLDLVVTDPGSGTHEPWILDPTPNATTLDLPATNGPDHLNNMEQVLINSPAAGDYDLDISGFNVPMGPQEYFVVYEIITENLTLTYPNGGDHFYPFVAESIHWDAVNTTADFDLEYSTDNGASWNAIATVPAGETNYAWAAPNVLTGEALIRITSGAHQDQSDEPFNFAQYPNVLTVTQVCQTEATVEWAPITGAESYDVYLLGDKYMEVEGNSTTESFTFPITDHTQPFWFAVQAKNATDGWEGRRSNAKLHPGGLVDCTLGVNDNILSDAVSIYPNPASDQVFVKLNDISFESFDIIVSNSLGQKLQTISTSGSNTEAAVNVSEYSTGLYFVTIKAGSSSTTKKLLIK